MNVTDYNHLINKPDAITEKQADALGSVLNEFPYFQSARALRLKGLYNQNSFKYNYALKVTAAHTTDRSVLFDFITSETFTSIQSEFYDQKLKDLLEIKVFDSEIISPEEIRKATEVRIDPIEKSILDSIKEATTAAFEEPIKTEEKPIDPIVEQSILTSINEAAIITLDESIKTEEEPIDPIILIPEKEDVIVTFEEPIYTEEEPIDVVNKQSALTPIETTITFEEVLKEEEPIDFVRESAPTFFEDRIDDEIPSIRIDPIEKSIFNALKEASTVIFEESKVIEEPKVTEELIQASEEKIPTVVFEELTAIEEPEATEELISTSEKETPIIIFEELTAAEALIENEVPETVKIAEENLEIGKPLDFSANEKHSFQEWLQLARTEPIDRTEEETLEETIEDIKEVEEIPEPIIETVTETIVGSGIETEAIDEEKKKKAEIINKFIETNPKIPPIKQTAIVPAVQLDSQEENSYLMTETLARVYLEQKKYTKAIQAYEILILKYPEKISFFADRISDIKILQQNNNNN